LSKIVSADNFLTIAVRPVAVVSIFGFIQPADFYSS
jgi:hypothetical protein